MMTCALLKCLVEDIGQFILGKVLLHETWSSVTCIVNNKYNAISLKIKTIYNISDDEIMDMYYKIFPIIKKEGSRGNTIEDSFIKHTIMEEYGKCYEHINIKKMVSRKLNFWSDYFADIKESINEQSTESWISLDEYMMSGKIVKTEIIVIFNLSIRTLEDIDESIELLQICKK